MNILYENRLTRNELQERCTSVPCWAKAEHLESSVPLTVIWNIDSPLRRKKGSVVRRLAAFFKKQLK